MPTRLRLSEPPSASIRVLGFLRCARRRADGNLTVRAGALGLPAAAELNPDDLRARIALAEAYQRAGDYAHAREAYQLAMGFFPENPAVHLAIGNLDLQESHYDQAKGEFETVLRWIPKTRMPVSVWRALSPV
jgi:tetratricopeptide (TPR) repeat protein